MPIFHLVDDAEDIAVFFNRMHMGIISIEARTLLGFLLIDQGWKDSFYYKINNSYRDMTYKAMSEVLEIEPELLQKSTQELKVFGYAKWKQVELYKGGSKVGIWDIKIPSKVILEPPQTKIKTPMHGRPPNGDDYTEYLQSDHWQQIRAHALARARYRCQLCNSDEDLYVHHRTYKDLGAEKIEDLTVLCRYCHDRHHDRNQQKA